jgi:RecA-family ATPase
MAEILNNAIEVVPRFKLIKVSDLTAQPKPIDWLLDGILEAGSLNLLFGEPASGKSLFAFDWAVRIASGRDWLGKETQKRDVVILAGEGHSGLRRRMRALEVKHGIKTPDNLLVSEIPANLTDVAQAQWVADAIKQNCTNGGLVIVDTLNRNMGAADENNAKDIAELLNIIDGCIRSMGLAVLIVHHSGHSNQGRARGSSAIRAAVDTEFCVTKKADSITLGCTKAKDFEPFKDMEFSLKVTELGDQWHDKAGQPITSVYLEYKGETSNTSKPKAKLSGRDSVILWQVRTKK